VWASPQGQERGIVGETPNLAARLQDLAEPNSVVIAESTRKLLGKLFELENLGARGLKGVAGPVRAWAALRPSRPWRMRGSRAGRLARPERLSSTQRQRRSAAGK
jgi:class 3 adenylate cyclase